MNTVLMISLFFLINVLTDFIRNEVAEKHLLLFGVSSSVIPEITSAVVFPFTTEAVLGFDPGNISMFLYFSTPE